METGSVESNGGSVDGISGRESESELIYKISINGVFGASEGGFPFENIVFIWEGRAPWRATRL
jgi:hypothetical protein